MLSFKFVTDAAGAAHYFQTTDDYYAKEGHVGVWQGKGAEMLGLAGGVDPEVFKNLLNGRLPDGQQVRKKMPKMQRDGKESLPRLGIDFTFSAPKSVSIAALVSGDERILKAHENAVSAAITLLEGKALARKKERGLSFRQHTNNLTFATFRHELSRTQDPQLHTHAVAMNLTRRDDGKWVALTNDQMLKSIKVVGAYYRSELAKQLEALGYDIRATRHGFELADVSDVAIKLFSKRSQQIEEALKLKGLDRDSASSKTKQTITKATRPKKTDADRAELRKEWIDVLEQAGIKMGPRTGFDHAKEKVRDVVHDIGNAITPQPVKEFLEQRRGAKETSRAKNAVDLSIEHLMERQGIFTRSELLERAYTRGLGVHGVIETEVDRAISDGRIIRELPLYQSAKSFSRDAQAEAKDIQRSNFRYDDVLMLTPQSWAAVMMARNGISQEEAQKLVQSAIASGRLVQTEERFTTKSMLADENAVLRMEVAGRGQVVPIKSVSEVDALFATSTLNEGQLSSAKMILTTPNRVVGVQGFAGVGKSHMLKEVKEVVDAITHVTAQAAVAEGYTVIGLAPYGSQNKALAELGMKSQTLASFLLRKKDQALLGPNTIVFLDESGVVPVHQMRDILSKVENAGARIVLLGDRKQTQAVEAGKSFEQLIDAGMATAHITEIKRQLDPELKAAVLSAATGAVKEAAKQLDTRTLEIRSPEERYEAIAKKYTSLGEDDRNNTLIVTGTNQAKRSINDLVRNNLGLEGGLPVDTLQSVDMSRAERKEASNFENGMVILAEGGKGGELQQGVHYTIAKVNDTDNKLTLAGSDGTKHELSPASLKNFSVYGKETISVAPGDWIRMTRNNSPLGIANGERYQVARVSPETLEFTNGLVLPRDTLLHLQYGYAMTAHSAQGLTKDRVLMDVDSASLTSNRAVFYVGISRPRKELFLYTDNKKLMPEKVAREPKKYAALELRDTKLESFIREREVSRQSLLRAVRQSGSQKSAAKNIRKEIRKSRKM
jgi:conjugative relaxase-like TrwC/TraI family protein